MQKDRGRPAVSTSASTRTSRRSISTCAAAPSAARSTVKFLGHGGTVRADFRLAARELSHDRAILNNHIAFPIGRWPIEVEVCQVAPIRTSLPALPLRVLLPAPPNRKSRPLPPSSVSSSFSLACSGIDLCASGWRQRDRQFSFVLTSPLARFFRGRRTICGAAVTNRVP